MNIDNNSVYIIASERSGTNLLRKLFTQHQSIYYGPSPAHFLKNLFYREPYYGCLKEDDHFKSLIKDALDLATIHFSPWQIDWDKEELLIEYGNTYGNRRNVVLLSHFLMKKYAVEQGFESYVCKDNDIFEFADAIKRELPDTKFIYLHRDPRDVALSQYERTLQTYSLARITALWRYEQIRSIRFYNSNPDFVYKLSYEDLITNEEKVIGSLCKFLGVEFSSSINDAEVFHGQSKEWANLSKPILRNNSKKYLGKFSRKKIQFIEFRLSSQMSYLGYEFDYPLVSFSRKYLIWDLVTGFLISVFSKIKKEKGDEWFMKRSKVLKRLSIKWKSPYL